MPNDSLTTGFRIFGGQVVFRADNETPGLLELHRVPVDGSSPPVKLSAGMSVGTFEVQDGFAVALARYGAAPVDLYSMSLRGPSSPVRLYPGVDDFQLSEQGGPVLFLARARSALFAVWPDGTEVPARFDGPFTGTYDDLPAMDATHDGSRVLFLTTSGLPQDPATSWANRLRMGFPARGMNQR
jgi:hypothetical protein